MKDVSMEELCRSLKEHKQLLEILGYRLDIDDNVIPLHNTIKIYKDTKIVGSLTHKDKNMYWLKEKNEVLANENINNMRFSQVPKYNKKPVFHLILDDAKFRCSCYNIFNKNYIAIENKKIRIKKFKDFIKIEMKNNEKIEFAVYYPDRVDNNLEYTDRINATLGNNAIDNIESYYSNKKIKVKK